MPYVLVHMKSFCINCLTTHAQKKEEKKKREDKCQEKEEEIQLH